jgi:hypothetical protein
MSATWAETNTRERRSQDAVSMHCLSRRGAHGLLVPPQEQQDRCKHVEIVSMIGAMQHATGKARVTCSQPRGGIEATHRLVC